MADVLDISVLARWQRQPLSFISEILRDPETSKPFVLLDAERAFLEHAYQIDDDGRLIYPEQLYGAPKKSGKTGFAAMHLLTTTLVFGGRFAEGYAIWSRRRAVCSSPRGVSVRRRRTCAASATSRRRASSSRRPVPSSRRLVPITLVALVQIR
jgi:hypothetical protein